MTNYIIMFGAPASGKGTHSKKLGQALDIPYISTGDMLRDLLLKPDNEKTDIERGIAKVMKEGGLVSDELVLDLIRERMAQGDCEKGCIFDGFPRTLIQKQELEKMLAADGGKLVKGVIRLDVNREELTNRFMERVEEMIKDGGTPREDDNRDSFGRRLNTYTMRTEPVLEDFRNSGIPIHVVNANGTKDQTAAAVRQAAQAILSNGLDDTRGKNTALREPRNKS